jgi:putative acetyltransferase
MVRTIQDFFHNGMAPSRRSSASIFGANLSVEALISNRLVNFRGICVFYSSILFGKQGAFVTTATWQITPAAGDSDLAAVRALLEEYWKSFGFTPCFQNFGDELAGMPGAYAPPTGRLALIRVRNESGCGEPAGCVALRRVDDRRAEPKRLYVRPAFRGHGLGRALLEWVMNEARAAGYCELVGDTMPQMSQALALYRQMGFECGSDPAPESQSSSPQLGNEPILIRITL